MSVDAAIARLAVAQHGPIHHSQLEALGLGTRAISHRRARGNLHQVHVGVYAVGHPRLSRKGHWMAAVLAGGDGALLSHRHAAALLGLREAPTGDIDVVLRQRSRRARPGLRIHRPRYLLAQDCIEEDGIPCTSVARTLLDLGEVLDDRALERAADEAELLEIFDLKAVEDVLDRAGGHRGAHRLRRVIALHDVGSTLTRSELEEGFLHLSDQAGLPRPLVNAWVPLPVPTGGIEVDFLWLAERLVVEVDGGKIHGRRRTFERDYDKSLLLDAAGFTVKRFTWRQLTEQGDQVIASVKRHLDRGANEGR